MTKPRPLRVVHCPVNTAGVPWTNVLALRRRGIDASLVVFNRYALHPEADGSLDLGAGVLRRQAKQWAALASLLPRTDVFHFMFGLTLVPQSLQYPILRTFRKRSVMHYLGMIGMRFGGYFDWDGGIVGLSIAIAIVAASAALWLAFHAKRRAHRAVAALVMGAAVCTMHYTGMAAASVVCTTANRRAFLPDLLRAGDLGVAITIVAIGVAAMVAMDVFLQRLHAGSAAVHA